MHYSLTPDELDLKSAYRGFLASRVPGVELEPEQADQLDTKLWTDLMSSGWLDLRAMEGAEDGSDWPAVGVHMSEELGRALVPAPAELVGGFLLPLLRELTPGAVGVRLEEDPFVNTVATASVQPLMGLVFGSKAAAPPMVQESTDGIIVSGTWSSVEFAASAQWLFLPIRLRAGWALTRVSLAAPGIDVEPARTILPGRPTGSITMSSVEISSDDIASTGRRGEPMEQLLREALLSYLLVLDGKAVGACELLLERTISYVTDRVQFGVPIGSFQAVKHRIADMATAIESARSLASYTAWQVAQGHEERVLAVLASRLHCADAYRRVVENAIQCHGGMGFTWEVGLHRWYQSAVYDAGSTGLTTADLARLLGSAR